MFLLSSGFCDNASVLATILFIKKIIKIISIVIPVALVLLLTIDILKAVMSDDESKMKNVQALIVKRIIYALVIFFVPIIVNAFFSLLDGKGLAYLDCYNAANDENVQNLVKKEKEEAKKAAQERQNNSNSSKNNSNVNKSSSSSSSSKSNSSNSSSTSKQNKTSNSQSFSVPSSVKKAKSYKKYHLLKNLNVKSSATIKPVGNNFISQSFAVVNNYYVVMVINRGENSTMISVHNKNTGTRVNRVYSNFHHANGTMYNPDNNTIYVAHGYLTFRYSSFSAANIDSVKKIKPSRKTTSSAQSALAYDSITKKYFVTNGRNFSVYSSLGGKKLKTIKRKVSSGLRADIGAHNGILYACRHNGGNFVDLYRESDGSYLGTYKLNVSGEIEGISYYGTGNKFSVLIYNSGTASDKIYTVDIPIP